MNLSSILFLILFIFVSSEKSIPKDDAGLPGIPKKNKHRGLSPYDIKERILKKTKRKTKKTSNRYNPRTLYSDSVFDERVRKGVIHFGLISNLFYGASIDWYRRFYTPHPSGQICAINNSYAWHKVWKFKYSRGKYNFDRFGYTLAIARNSKRYRSPVIISRNRRTEFKFIHIGGKFYRIYHVPSRRYVEMVKYNMYQYCLEIKSKKVINGLGSKQIFSLKRYN